MTLVDTNVLLDLVTGDPRWAAWSQHQIAAAWLRGRLVVNAVVYAELSVRYDQVEPLDAMLTAVRADLAEMPRAGLFLAGKAFAAYRARGGTRTGVLPDFLIGAHAAVARLPLLTRDAGRYRTYFPAVTLILPEGA